MLAELRHKLHSRPELSGSETETAGFIADFIKQFKPAALYKNIGGNSLAAVYDFGKGPTVMVRCELDALPINEETDLQYKSLNRGVAHKCGHDGHMSIVAGLAPWLAEKASGKGRVVLLFQAAEETAEGARAVLDDPAFKQFEPDYIFALHNLPGYARHSIIIGKGQMTPTVLSLSIKVKGRTSHAAEPQKGLNPTLAISTLNMAVLKLANSNMGDDDYSMITAVHTRIGSRDYGISPGEGELHFTLRTWNEEAMDNLKEEISKVVADTCYLHQLEYEIGEADYFPTVNNDDTCNSIIIKAASDNNLEVLKLDKPIKFGEDFGYFTRGYKAALFGLGAGEFAPPLHHADYDFPDELIETGISVYKGIINQILAE